MSQDKAQPPSDVQIMAHHTLFQIKRKGREKKIE